MDAYAGCLPTHDRFRLDKDIIETLSQIRQDIIRVAGHAVACVKRGGDFANEFCLCKIC